MQSVARAYDPRPWAGTASRNNIRPMVIIQRRNRMSTLPPDQPYVVLTTPDDKGDFRYVMLEQAQRFTVEQLLEGRLPPGVTYVGNLHQLGIDERNDSWMLTICCTVEGEYPG